jgi:hypothetical protein
MQLIGAYLGLLVAASFTATAQDLESGRRWLWPKALLAGGATHACAFCGLTRSFCALSQGNVVGAWRYHTAGPVLYVTFLAAGVWSTVSLASDFRRRRASRPAPAPVQAGISA